MGGTYSTPSDEFIRQAVKSAKEHLGTLRFLPTAGNHVVWSNLAEEYTVEESSGYDDGSTRSRWMWKLLCYVDSKWKYQTCDTTNFGEFRKTDRCYHWQPGWIGMGRECNVVSMCHLLENHRLLDDLKRSVPGFLIRIVRSLKSVDLVVEADL